MASWSPRQPRLDYSPEKTMRELSLLILGLAKESASERRSDKKDEVQRLAMELNKVENERNWYVGEVTKTQNAINAITEGTTSLKDIYKTASIPGITADVTDKPLEYYRQKIAEANAQMDILKPYYGRAVSELGSINRAYNFLQKGEGASSGIDKIFGPEDFTEAVYAKGEELLPSEKLMFKKYPAPESLYEGLQAKKVIAATTHERAESVSRYNEYADERTEGSMHFFPINALQTDATTHPTSTEREREDKANLMKQLDIMYLREGIGFLPAAAGVHLGVSYHSTNEKLEELFELMEGYEELGNNIDRDMHKQLTLFKDAISYGKKLRNVNIKRYNETNVKSGVTIVQPYLERDKLLAEAFHRYKEILKLENDNLAEDFRIHVKNTLGIDLYNRATIRKRLKRYFMEDLYEEYTGGVPFEKLSESDQEFYMRRALEIEEKYGFSIDKGDFLDE